MKMSSKKTMLTAAVLVTLSSSTALAATPGTVDSQELFRANRLVTDPAKNPALEEKSTPDQYEASISAKKKESAHTPPPAAPAAKTSQPARLRWDSVDARLAARNNDPSFSLSAQKAKPVIITADDIRREEKLAEKEGRPVQELVGDVNMNRPAPPPKSLLVPGRGKNSVSQEGVDASVTVQEERKSAVQIPGESSRGNVQRPVSDQRASMQTNPSGMSAHTNMLTASKEDSNVSSSAAVQQEHTAANSSSRTQSAGSIAGNQQPPSRPRYPQLPHSEFSLTPPAENGAAPKQPERFESLGNVSTQHPTVAPVKDRIPAAAHSVRPEGVPELSSRQEAQHVDDLRGISDEVRRHILAGQLAMEVQLKRDPSVAGMRAITKVLRENTTLTRLQKIDFLIGFGRALHQSGLPRQQEALLIKTIAEAF